MGKLNTAMRTFLCDRERFADLFNGVFFQGKPVIRADRLLEGSETYSDMTENPLDRTRDLKMITDDGETLRILALENQENIDYTLPYRCMQYDSLEYGRQLRELKKYNKARKLLSTPAERICGITRQNRLAPVYTLCLYHGEEPWDGPLSLRDMVDFGADREDMGRFFADYPITLFCINEQESFHMFQTELREVFAVMNLRRNKRQLYEVLLREPSYQTLDAETVKVLSVILNAPRLWSERKRYINRNENKEEYDMCQAMRELLADAAAAGKEQGINQGISQGISQGAADKTRIVVTNMLARGMSDEDICAIAECNAEFIQTVRMKGR
ncbi:MAG: hypothetical protein K2K63_16480 [Acetatifactor sp.]|nr:hypothetical protein [Acetatifactor sp.]